MQSKFLVKIIDNDNRHWLLTIDGGGGFTRTIINKPNLANGLRSIFQATDHLKMVKWTIYRIQTKLNQNGREAIK